MSPGRQEPFTGAQVAPARHNTDGVPVKPGRQVPEQVAPGNVFEQLNAPLASEGPEGHGAAHHTAHHTAYHSTCESTRVHLWHEKQQLLQGESSRRTCTTRYDSTGHLSSRLLRHWWRHCNDSIQTTLHSHCGNLLKATLHRVCMSLHWGCTWFALM